MLGVPLGAGEDALEINEERERSLGGDLGREDVLECRLGNELVGELVNRARGRRQRQPGGRRTSEDTDIGVHVEPSLGDGPGGGGRVLRLAR